MKKAVALLCCGVIASSMLAPSVYAQTFDNEVYPWMYEKWLTTVSLADFRPSDNITRGEVSKNFNKMAQVLGLEKVKTSAECQFNDIEWYDNTLVPNIIEACEYGLVKWSNGNYFPNNPVTEAEVLTVAIRMILGVQDESRNPRWSETFDIANSLNIINKSDVWSVDVPASRSTVGTWLYRTAFTDIEQANTEGIEELKAILEEVFGEWFFDE